MSFHGTYETPWFHEKELGLMQTLSRYGWLGILPWGSTLSNPSSMGGVRECCSSLCDTDECCKQGRFVSKKLEACSWWPQGSYDRDFKFVDRIWKWLEDHTCVDRTQACKFVSPNQLEIVQRVACHIAGTSGPGLCGRFQRWRIL